jgi:hypothetical protein
MPVAALGKGGLEHDAEHTLHLSGVVESSACAAPP